ncbi:LRR receptor-like serine/threonine-protein kinase GSO2 [Herrania umbratica]|uniref:LRR receptor-like serine/threonine-protein kinase GSO2 n=1 Tax=Herrania umbratica TaxID=108875 RepID=A0A6J1AP64_9ROSI|nr:LRR receptor-like serine/threonine-protein kinase GSO2 [Herrania umbratica]
MMVMMSGARSQLLLLVLFVAIFHLLVQEKSTTAEGLIMCNEGERQALLDFKQSLQVVDQVGNGGLSSWDGKDCCAWTGVYCNIFKGYVETLDLSERFWLVSGTISPSLLKLQHLSGLFLRENDFNGSRIPEFIGSLKNLVYLDLSLANFKGPIPSQLGNLSKLETLCLGSVLDPNYLYNMNFNNKFPKLFSGNLEWLSRLTSLKHLDLSFTNLSKASDWLQVVNQLPFLEKLSMNDCDLPSAFPSSLSLVNSSTSLTSLHLSGNYLTSSAIYPWLFNVSSNLVFLDLSRNQLKGPIPESFGNMVDMEYLSLSHNQLEGGIYRSFWSMCSLRYLVMESNHLSAFGFVQNTSFGTADSLEDLRLAQNQLMSSVLNEVANLSSLRVLDLGYNLLKGTISESIGQLSNLWVLRLAGNSFENVVISEAHFSNLTKLWELDLSYTSLTLKFNSGWIPPFQLGDILLSSCKLGPRFPEWLRTQNLVRALDISVAEISDSLPHWFWDQYYQMEYLNLSFNQINGTLPSNSIEMSRLDLSSNNLSGPLPRVLSVLLSLNLSKNKFFGSISSICNIINKDGLRVLDLSINQFSGVVPNCFAQFPKLTALNLADNNLSGPISSSLGSLASLEMLSLHGNRFAGKLPSSPWNCTKLKFLDLSDNRLSGKLSLWNSQSLPRLVFLNLQNNQFTGKIPFQLCGLKHIQILDLSVNKISGTIPGCLNNFTSMAQKVDLDQRIEHLFTVPRFGYVTNHPYGAFVELNYVDEALLVWKGKKQLYAKILGLLLVIDLSSNKLTGEIPEEISSLQELIALNLSRNFLTGQIPRKIGQLGQLQSLDLSRNKISGSIPPSLSELTFLGSLDLSYNYLSGKIPSGTQLQGFDPSIFSHNHGLCGPPVTPNCSGSVEVPQGQLERGQDDFDEFLEWFYAGMGIGFVVGFWGFCGALLFKRSGRHSYFRFLDEVKDWLYVTYALQKARLERRIQA